MLRNNWLYNQIVWYQFSSKSKWNINCFQLSLYDKFIPLFFHKVKDLNKWIWHPSWERFNYAKFKQSFLLLSYKTDIKRVSTLIFTKQFFNVVLQSFCIKRRLHRETIYYMSQRILVSYEIVDTNRKFFE